MCGCGNTYKAPRPVIVPSGTPARRVEKPTTNPSPPIEEVKVRQGGYKPRPHRVKVLGR